MTRADGPHDGVASPGGEARSVAETVAILASVVRPSSVVDLGSADAAWLRCFEAHGVDDVLLVRPPLHPALEGTHAPTLAHDLRRPLRLDRRFDLAVAIGAGEHLPSTAAAAFVRTLCDAADTVAFAAVLPGLAPPGTVNARWPAWWDGIFADQGYVAHDVVRPHLWEEECVDVWIRQCLVLYAAPARFGAVPLPVQVQRSIVHPEAYHSALWSLEARRASELALAAERTIAMEADCARLAEERARLADELAAEREGPTERESANLPDVGAAGDRERRDDALLRAALRATEVELGAAPSPAQLVAVGRRPLSTSLAAALTTAFPVRRRFRRLIGPGALLWDEAFYVSQAPEALFTGLGPLLHYRRHGARQLRSPHPWFDPVWYVTRNPDVVARGQSPLEHHLRTGWREGRDPHPLFATTWYGRAHAARDGWRRSPLEHYLERGRHAGLPPHPLFDTRWYLEVNTDVGTAREDPVDHFCRKGWREGRNPHPLFDVGWYLERNPDVVAEGVNPLVHYLWFGWREGRDPHPLFDAARYLAENPDVRESGAEPLGHFLTVGAAEGRSTGHFDTAWYADRHPESAAGGRNPLVFFVETGRARGDAATPLPDG